MTTSAFGGRVPYPARFSLIAFSCGALLGLWRVPLGQELSRRTERLCATVPKATAAPTITPDTAVQGQVPAGVARGRLVLNCKPPPPATGRVQARAMAPTATTRIQDEQRPYLRGSRPSFQHVQSVPPGRAGDRVSPDLTRPDPTRLSGRTLRCSPVGVAESQ